jgi:hypothetical protein
LPPSGNDEDRGKCDHRKSGDQPTIGFGFSAAFSGSPPIEDKFWEDNQRRPESGSSGYLNDYRCIYVYHAFIINEPWQKSLLFQSLLPHDKSTTHHGLSLPMSYDFVA